VSSHDTTLYLANPYLYQVNGVNGGDTVFLPSVCVCVCVCVCARACVRSGPVNQTGLKRLKLRTSYLTSMFPWTLRTWPLKNFGKEGVCGQGHVPSPLIFWALSANCSKTVRATDFKFDVHVLRDSPDMAS